MGIAQCLPSMHQPFGSIPCTQGQEKGRLARLLNNDQLVALAYFMSLEIRIFSSPLNFSKNFLHILVQTLERYLMTF